MASFDMNKRMIWFRKVLIALVMTTMNSQTRGKSLVHYSNLQSNSSRRQYMVTTEEEIHDTYFVPHAPAVVPNYPVSVITQPVLPAVRLKQTSKPYRAIGCYKDALPRAVPSLEGSDSFFSEYYKSRINPVDKCAKVASARGYEVFTIQNGGFCSSGSNAHNTFQIYGPAKNCRNGRGGEWANDVYIFNEYTYEVTVHTGTEQKNSTDGRVSVTLYGSLGSSRSIELKSETPKDPFQSGQVDQFLVHTIPLGDLVRLHICHDNVGPLAEWHLEKISIKDPKNKIYIFPCNCWLKDEKGGSQTVRNLFPATVLNPGSFMFVGCYKKNHEDRAIHAITDDILDGHPSSALNKKEYVIEKCAHRARQKGLLFFGIHNGDECSLSSRAQNTYDLYGSAVDCYKNGTGGVSSNAVYTFSDQEPISGKVTDTN